MIATAIQKGNTVYVYGTSGNILFTRNGILLGFTSSSVSIKVGGATYVYNDKGSIMFTR